MPLSKGITPPRNILVCTTFANKHWAEYAGDMVNRFDHFWPANCSLIVTLDDLTLAPEISPVIARRGGAISTLHDDKEFQAFRQKYEGKDDPNDYRRQFFRFSHKIFALRDAMVLAAQNGFEYVVWLDADVLTEKAIPEDVLREWMPTADGELASYLGRKDWPHSECGFMAFKVGEVAKGGVVQGNKFFSDLLATFYLNGAGLKEKQCDDSWLFDVMRTQMAVWSNYTYKNLTPDVPGMNVWEKSILAPYMTHHKGQVAKVKLAEQMGMGTEKAISGSKAATRPLDVKIKNCLPHDEIRRNVSDNLALMPRWIPDCIPSNETVVFVSGGPMLDVDKVKKYAQNGYRIVCVKHALERLLQAGIVPWACVLLDPRVHVENFVQKPDPRVNYFVASMVDPKVVMRLLENKCKVWGYHAAVGAEEQQYVARGTPYIAYGSASAVRGLFVLKALGFEKFILLGYDLCHGTKPDLNERLPDGNKKYLEVVLNQPTWGGGQTSRTFWTEGQLLAQAQEMERIVNDKMVDIVRAEGDGIVPWMLEHKRKHKQWMKTVYAPLQPSRPTADQAIGNPGWRNRLHQFLTTIHLR